MLRPKIRRSLPTERPSLQRLEPRIVMSVVGALDYLWNGNGKVFTDFGTTDDDALAMAVQPDGKVIQAGGVGAALAQDFALVRYDQFGILDPTFGNGGKVTTDMGGGDQIHSIALQPDGKIVAAGLGGDNHIAVARYNADGSLDTSFANGGKLIFGGQFDNAFATVIQPDGKILVAGATRPLGGTSFNMIALRINPNGSLDTSFNNGPAGFAQIDLGGSDLAFNMALQPDGKVVITGGTTDPGDAPSLASQDLATIRLNTDGSLDNTFGTNGLARTNFGAYEFAQGLLIDPSGRIVISGEAQVLPSRVRNGIVVRYNANGTIDTNFAGGLQNFDTGNEEELNSITLDSANRLVVAGTIFPPQSASQSQVLVVRFLPDGGLDPAFANGGGYVINDLNNGSADDAHNVAIAPDGHIVVGANSRAFTGNTANTDFAITRYRVTDPLTTGPIIAIGTDQGVTAGVRVFDRTGNLKFSFIPYESTYTGGVRTAVGDVNGDGVADIVVGPGPGHTATIRVYDGATQAPMTGPFGSFVAFDPAFQGGVNVAVGDVNVDGHADVIVSEDSGGESRVNIYNGMDGGNIGSFVPYNNWSGGTFVAAGDVTGDGRPDVITGAGAGAGPHVKAFDLVPSTTNPALVKSFFAYASGFLGGVRVASGDVNNDGRDDIITAAGAGAPPHIKAFSGTDNSTLASYYAYSTQFLGGARVAVGDVNGDGIDDIVTAPGFGGGPHIRVFAGGSLAEISSYFAFDPRYLSGNFVAVG